MVVDSNYGAIEYKKLIKGRPDGFGMELERSEV